VFHTRFLCFSSLSFSFACAYTRKKELSSCARERACANRRRVNACSFACSLALSPSLSLFLSLTLSRAPRDLSIRDLRHHLIPFSSLAHWTLLVWPTLLPPMSSNSDIHFACALVAPEISRATLSADFIMNSLDTPFFSECVRKI